MAKVRFLCLLLFPVVPAAAQERRLPADTYVFSDLCVGDSAYDVRGHRVELRLGPVIGNETVTIEFSEFGADRGPLRSYRVNFEDAINREDNANHLEFSYLTQIDEYTFTGTVSANGDRLEGIFDDQNGKVTLPHVSTGAPVRPRCADQ